MLHTALTRDGETHEKRLILGGHYKFLNNEPIKTKHFLDSLSIE